MFKINRNFVAPVLAEYLGTGILVMVTLVLSQITAVSYFVATSVATAAVVVYMLFGAISGAHTNPAVTFGMWTARKIGTLRGISYIAAQLLGAVSSWQLFQYFVNHTLTARQTSFTTPIWLAELVGTAIVAIAFTLAMNKKNDMLSSSIAVGAAYFAGIMIASTASSGFINPAIALGARSWGSAYVLGPLVGGLIGVNLYAYMTGTWSSLPVRRRRAASSVTVKRTAVRGTRK
ncbi:MAG TPA: aquaporin [Candidatus Saccharimonadales bacterium]|nr:aquaporin [Candidatus Saccharimonadales bacterium]